MTLHPDQVTARRGDSVYRLTVVLQFLLVAAFFVLALASMVLPDFARPSWLRVGLVFSIVAWVVNLVAGWQRAEWLKRAGVNPRSHFPQLARSRLVALWVLLLVGSATLMVIAGRPVVAARFLGPTPAQAQLVSAKEGPHCYRCIRQVVATYEAGGSMVTTPLAGGGGYDLIEDQAGEPLVYDPVHPRRVMRASDWEAGRSGGTVSLFVIGLALLVLTSIAPLPVVRRRRSQFGTLKPDTEIRSARYLRVRKKLQAWRVDFADNTQARYRDSAELRAALRARIGEAGMASLDPASRAKLERS